MAWPQTVDYNAAVQNPSACFADGELARGRVAEGLMPGIPLSYAGNFATVYKVETPGGVWAVKCFTRKVDNLQLRYREISDHLHRRRRRFAVDFQYLEEGVRVDGVWWAAVKMQWVEGLTLNEFLRERVGSPAVLEQLGQLWLRLAAEMREDRMAHGDLQHGNVLLVPGASGSSLLLRLVDYDGMWVPGLAQTPPVEVGHPNYQHPQRLAQGGYDADIDRFSLLGVYTALRCLMVGGKALWNAFDNEENVLFREADFKDPAKSKLFARLLTLSDAETVTLTARLLLACQGTLEETPRLSEVLDNGRVLPLSAEQRDRVLATAPAALLPAPALPRPTRLRPAAVPPPPLPVLAATGALVETSVLAPMKETVASPALRMRADEPPVVPPPLPVTAARSRHSLRAGLRRVLDDGKGVARRRPLAVGVALGLVVAVMVGLLWPTAPTPPVEPPGPRLLPVDGVSLRAGHVRETPIVVARPSPTEELTVAVADLPAGVECSSTAAPAGAGAAEVRLHWKVDVTAPVFDGQATLRLARGGRVLDEQRVPLRVSVFQRPRLRTDEGPEPVRLEPGKSQLVLLRVHSQGNTDPWTLRIDPLPEGVSQRPPPADVVPAGMVGVELTAGRSAPEKEGFIGRISLLADGVLADSANIVLTVQRPVVPVSVALTLPNTPIRLAAGEKVSFTVQLRRTGPAGTVRLEVDDLPPGVRAVPLDVSANDETAEIELRADAGAGGKLELQSFRLVARSDGKVLGIQEGTFHLKRAGGEKPASVPAMPLPEAREVRFTTPDYALLNGTLYPAVDGRKSACVLLVGEPARGVTRKEESWVRLAKKLQQKGCGVLTFDFRGFGDNRLTRNDLPALFWMNPANGKTLLGLRARSPTRGKRPEVLEGSHFPPAYLPWLVQDLVGARYYLDLLHEEGQVNTHNLIVIGAGEGATLAAFWLASEFRRHRVAGLAGLANPTSPAEGRDVRGAVWIDLSPTLGRTAIPLGLAALRREYKAEKQPPDMLFVHDRKGRGKRMQLSVLNQPESAEKPIDGPGANGQAVVSHAEAEKAVVDFVGTVLDKHPLRPWAVRGLKTGGYVWMLGRKAPVAKANFGSLPVPLPMDLFGFAQFSLR